jgi:hypothetical protein
MTACEYGHLDCLQYLISLSSDNVLSRFHLLAAARGGNVEVFLYVLQHCSVTLDDVFYNEGLMSVSRNEDADPLPMFKFFIEHSRGQYKPSQAVLDTAASMARLQFLCFARDNGFVWTPSAASSSLMESLAERKKGGISAIRYCRSAGAGCLKGQFTRLPYSKTSKWYNICLIKAVLIMSHIWVLLQR